MFFGRKRWAMMRLLSVDSIKRNPLMNPTLRAFILRFHSCVQFGLIVRELLSVNFKNGIRNPLFFVEIPGFTKFLHSKN